MNVDNVLAFTRWWVRIGLALYALYAATIVAGWFA